MPTMTQIKASAGSGKTYTLTQQFLAHLSLFGAKTARERACTLNGPESDWRSVMAITFTNAAASEMQERVLKFLKERALGIGANKELKLTQKEALIWLERIMHDRASLNISTIDSLLNLIVRMSALSENLPPDFTPVFTTGEILDPIWQALSNEAWQGNAQLKGLITEICQRTAHNAPKKSFLAGESVTSTLALLTGLMLTEKLGTLVDPDLLQKPNGDGPLSRLKRKVWELSRTVAQAQGTVPPGETKKVVMDKRFNDALWECVRLFDDALGTDDSRKVSNAQLAKIAIRGDFVSCLEKKSFNSESIKLNKGSALPALEVVKAHEELVASVAELMALSRIHAQSRINQPFLELARIVHERYTENLQRDGQLPNDRIPVMVERILSSDHGVAEALCRMGTRVTHFLVDEFQDTSRDHWRALKPLVVEALSTGGSFSWVGDVKQAIYGFRGGDSELFEDISHDGDLVRMLDGDVERRTLDCNWRSRKEIIEFNNALFRPLEDVEACRDVLEPDPKKIPDYIVPVRLVPGLADEGEDPQTTLLDHVARKMAQAYRGGAQRLAPKTTDGGSVSLILFSKKSPEEGNDTGDGGQTNENERMDEGADEQLDAVTAIARHERANGHPWSDMLALVRTNANAMKLARHLSAEGIPVITENSLLLDEHPLISQTLALLTFLRAPEDDVAFWTLITGSILARGSMDDFPLSRRDLDKELALLSATRDRREQGHVEPLARLWREQHPEFWETVMTPLMDASGSITPYDLVSEWYAREGVWERFPEAEPFLSRFLEILHTARVKDIRSLGDFLDYWEAHGHEEKVPMPEGMDAMRIMTTHKAKGLQAPVVIVPWTSAKGNDRGDLNIIEYVSQDLGTIRALCRDKRGIFPISSARTLKNRFEAMNGFYVAFTRAEQSLYIFLAQQPQGNGKHMQRLLDHAGDTVPAPVPWKAFAQKLTTSAASGDASQADDGQGSDAQGAASADAPVLPFDLDEDTPGGTNLPSGGWSLDGREGNALSTSWMPMEWMPKLRLHFDYQDESHPRDRAREEGVFVHACLEELARLPKKLRLDPEGLDRAIERILEERKNRTFWLCDGTDFLDRARRELAWYVDVDRKYGWMEHGFPEQSILTPTGRVLRTDLLVLHPDGPMVIEYKHGLAEDEYMRQYHDQVRAYLNTLRATDPKSRPLGIVVYLKPAQLHLVTADGKSYDETGEVSGDEAPLTLLEVEEFDRVMQRLRSGGGSGKKASTDGED